MLVMDDVRQSYVDLDDPTYLDFEYVQYFASVLATLPAGPLAVTHIGGGGLTLPRYLQASRPGSPQIVLEPDAELTELVRSRLPLPREHRIRIRPVDGRAGVAELADASADVVVLDAYADGRVPAALTTLEFFTDVARVLKPGGLLLANLVDEPGLRLPRAGCWPALRAAFGELALVSSQRRAEGAAGSATWCWPPRPGRWTSTSCAARSPGSRFRPGSGPARSWPPGYGTARPWTDAESSRVAGAGARAGGSAEPVPAWQARPMPGGDTACRAGWPMSDPPRMADPS